MKKLLALTALLVPFAAQSATYYVSDCQAGAVAGCVRGNDASTTPGNPATPWRTFAKAIAQFNAMGPGDRVLLAKGGAFSNSGEKQVQNVRTTVGNPITLGAYQPAWYAGSQAPIITQTNSGTTLSFTNGGPAQADAGYIIRDIHLRSATSFETAGVFVNQLASDIKLMNVIINNYGIGVYCGNDGQRITLQNSYVINNRHQGVLWSCSNSLIANNHFDNNGYGDVMRDHQMYFSSSAGATQTGTVVRNNKLTRSVHFNGDRCTGVPIVGHSKLSNMAFENNQIIETTKAGDGCWGIIIDGGYDASEGAERFASIRIRGNLLVNMGGIGVGCTSCQNWVIENNVLIWEHRVDGYIGIQIPNRPLDRWDEDAPMTRVIVRNNNVYFKQPGNWNVGIKVSDTGAGHIISSNMIHFAAAPLPGNQCFGTDNLDIEDFGAITNNLCFGNVRFNADYANLGAALFADPDWNSGGLTSHPNFVQVPTAANNYSMALKAASPAINAGDPANCSTLAFGGVQRNLSRCDIGAYEYVGP